MADYGTTYIFRIDVEGADAVKHARELRSKLDAAIMGGQTPAREVDLLRRSYADLAKQTDLTGKSITSITRRLTYQRTGMKATEASILTLGTHYQTLLQLMDKAGTEPFASMIQAALKMQDQIVGNSIIPDMVFEAIRYFQTLRAYGVGTFEAIIQAAQPLQRFSETMDVQVRGVIADPDIVAVGKDPFKAMAEGAKEAAKETEKVKTEMDKLSEAINTATIRYFGMRRIGYGLAYSGRVIARAGEALTGALMGASEAYLEFEQRATIAGVAMEMQSGQIDDLEKAILDTSIALALFSPEELLEGTRQWAAGTGVVIETQEDLNKLMGETIDIQKMAALNSVDLAKSVDVVGGVMHEFGLETKDVTHITEVLNYVAAKTFANVLDVGDAFKMVGPIAAQLGVSMEEVAVTIGLVSDANIKGSRAGRALRQMFQRLLKPTREYDAMMEKLLKNSLKTGQTWKDLIMPGGVFVGLAEYFDILAAATEGYTAAERAAALATLATANELPALVHLVERTIELRKEGKSLVEEELAAVLDAHGLMTRSFETLEESESYRVEQMKRRWNAATLAMGGAVQKNMIPYMEAWYDWITDIVEQLTEHPEILKWLALSGFGLRGVGAAVGGLGEAINIGANIAIMDAAVGEFGGYTKMFKIATAGLVGALTKLIPILAGLWLVGGIAAEITGFKRLEEEYPASLRETVQDMMYIDSRAGLLFAKGEELRDVFLELFGKTWVVESAANLDKIYARVQELRAAVAEPPAVRPTAAAQAAMPVMPVAGYAITNEAEALMAYLEYLNRVDEVTEAYYAQRQTLIDSQLDWEADALEAFQRKEEKNTEAHYQALGRAAEDQQNRLTQLHGKYVATMLATEAEYQRKLADLLEDYTTKEDRAQQATNLKRSELEENYRREGLEAAEDYQRNLRRLEADHLERMDGLIRTRDARGLLLEVQQHSRRLIEVGEDYSTERSRRQQDFIERQTELADNYALQKQQRLEDYQERLSDLAEAHTRQKAERLASYESRRRELEQEYALRRARRVEDYEQQRIEAQEQYALQLQARQETLAEQLTALEKSWQEQLTTMKEAEQEKLAALIEAETKQEAYLREHYAILLADFRTFLEDYDTVWQQFAAEPLILPILLKTGVVPAKGDSGAYERWEPYHLPEGLQEGGYAYGGIYTLGEAGREFVLSAPTTRAAEKQLGTPLGQGSFGGAGGSRIVVDQRNWRFEGSFTEGDKEWFRQAAKEAAYEGIVEVVSG